MGSNPQNFRVMVVDDNRDAAFMTCSLLGMLGYDAMAAYGGAEALALVGSFRPDIVFLDLSMPDVSGIEVAECLRKSFQHRIRIVALSALADESIRSRTREAGFDAHLQKPANIEQLVAQIKCCPPSRQQHDSASAL